MLKLWLNFFLKFCWTKVHFVGPLLAPILDFVWPSPGVSKPGWFSCLHTHLLACSEPKGNIWCYTCLFHQQGCTLYKHVYSRPAFQTSIMQAVDGRQQWMLTFGSGEIQSHAAGLTSECAIHSATSAGSIMT